MEQCNSEVLVCTLIYYIDKCNRGVTKRYIVMIVTKKVILVDIGVFNDHANMLLLINCFILSHSQNGHSPYMLHISFPFHYSTSCPITQRQLYPDHFEVAARTLSSYSRQLIILLLLLYIIPTFLI
jgi:hypothetical protein